MHNKKVGTFSIPMEDLFIIIGLFVIAHGLMLLNGGIYFDDWTLYHGSSQVIINSFNQLGVPQVGWIHAVLHNHPFLYRGLTFSSLLLASVFFYKILLSIKEIERFERLFLTLCFFLFPVNFAKITAITFPYSFFLFLFILATYCLSNYLLSKNKIYYALALMIYFFSFTVCSLLIFYAVGLMLIVYHERILDKWPGSITKLKQYIPFIVLPCIFWMVKSIWLRAYGEFGSYNKLMLGSVIKSPVNACITVYDNLIRPLLLPWAPPQLFLFIPIGVVILIFLYIYFKKNHVERGNVFPFFYFGLFSYFLAVFPYLAVGRVGVPYGQDWASRDQLLVPFAAAFIILYGTEILVKEFRLHPNIRLFFLAVILASFTTTQICYYLRFQRDWFKELALIEAFKTDLRIKENHTFLIDDQTVSLSVYSSRFYQYNGMMKYAFGDETRFAIDRRQLGATPPGKCIDNICTLVGPYPEYNMSRYIFKGPIYLITIRPGPVELRLRDVFHRTLMQWYNKDQFLKLTKDMVSIETSPLPQ